MTSACKKQAVFGLFPILLLGFREARGRTGLPCRGQMVVRARFRHGGAPYAVAGSPL